MIKVTADTAGQVIAGLYRALGLSQRQFARQLAEATGKNFDGTKAQLWTWESGTRRPDLVSFENALKALGFGLAVIPLDEEPEPDKGAYGVPGETDVLTYGQRLAHAAATGCCCPPPYGKSTEPDPFCPQHGTIKPNYGVPSGPITPGGWVPGWPENGCPRTGCEKFHSGIPHDHEGGSNNVREGGADGPICTPDRRLDHGHTVACGPMALSTGILPDVGAYYGRTADPLRIHERDARA